jgi:hypothetical protein
MTTTTTGFKLDLRRARHNAAGVLSWGTKTAALAALRGRGLNCEPDIEVHQAETNLWRFWVIGRPDHFNGVTYLMADGGQWVRGRLFDAAPCWCPSPCRGGHAAPWTPLAGALEPASFTHVTRAVVDSANRHEWYRTKSNGSQGRYVYTDDSVALCTCGWKKWKSTRPEACWAARQHLAEWPPLTWPMNLGERPHRPRVPRARPLDDVHRVERSPQTP